VQEAFPELAKELTSQKEKMQEISANYEVNSFNSKLE